MCIWLFLNRSGLLKNNILIVGSGGGYKIVEVQDSILFWKTCDVTLVLVWEAVPGAGPGQGWPSVRY